MGSTRRRRAAGPRPPRPASQPSQVLLLLPNLHGNEILTRCVCQVAIKIPSTVERSKASRQLSSVETERNLGERRGSDRCTGRIDACCGLLRRAALPLSCIVPWNCTLQTGRQAGLHSAVSSVRAVTQFCFQPVLEKGRGLWVTQPLAHHSADSSCCRILARCVRSET